MKKNIKHVLTAIPAVTVVTCAYVSLSGYVSPSFTAKTANDKLFDNSSIFEIDTTSQNAGDSKSDSSKAVSDVKAYEDGVYEGTGTGFGGETKVQVTIKDGKIFDIKILTNHDDASYINRASSLLKDIIATQSTNVDTVSGATYSSNGLIQAVRDALNKAAVSDEYKASISAANTASNRNSASNSLAPRIANISENGTYKDGTYTGEGNGFAGKIKVQVVIKDGKIKSIKILSTSDGADYISKAKGIISNIVSKQSTNVDTVSGATYSSNGIISAVRNALSKASVKTNGSTKKSNGNETSSTSNIKSNQTSNVNSVKIKSTGKFPYDDSVYTGVGEGYRGDVKVSVTIKNKTITSIVIVSNSDDATFFNRAKSIVGTMLAKQSTKVDVVAGATFSSNGIIEAVENALKEAEKATNKNSSSKKDEFSKSDNKTDSKVDSKTDSSSESNSDSSIRELEYQDGTYTVTAICVADDYDDFDAYTISAEVTIKSDKIVSISNVMGYGDDYDTDNDWYIKRAVYGTTKYKGIVNQYINSSIGSSIDTVSGATCSSNAIIQAVNDAIKKAKKQLIF